MAILQSTSVTDLTINGVPNQGFPSGTSAVFQQTSAPVGWTKSTTHNNKALRVVNGTVGSGGSVDFTNAFTSQTPSGSVSTTGTVSVANKALNSTSLMPSHNHSTTRTGGAAQNSHNVFQGRLLQDNTTVYVNSTGGNGNHNHSASFSGSSTFTGTAMNLAVRYVDLIIATKD